MDLTELFFGFRSKRQRRTALLREISGLALPSTLVTGAITANKASVFNTIRAATNMKACGHSINATVKAPFGAWKTKS